MHIDTALFSSCYLPPIQYFANLIQFNNVLIEQWEWFIKQTFRNRCCILSANGVLSLSIPIQHNSKNQVPIKDVKISYGLNWQRIHWKSIESSYRSSPYFEYYEDLFKKFYEKTYVYLFDYNQEILQLLFSLLKFYPSSLHYTDKYEKIYPNHIKDYRTLISPKNKNTMEKDFFPQPYFQVFSQKYEFIPNLSIIDLLFNQGNNTLKYLKSYP